MKVSIIIPVYNVAPYIEQCLLSVIAQTCQDEIECIIVDDCSTDGSRSICEHIISAYEGKIHFHTISKKKNEGLSSARNSGLEVAQGEYVYFLDGDDWIEPDLMASLIDAVSDATDVVSFDYTCFGRDNAEITFSPIELSFRSVKERVRFICCDLLHFNHTWSAWSRIYKKSIIDRYQIRFQNNSYIFAEDLCFFLSYLVVASTYKHINRTLYHYLVRDGSLMKAPNADGDILKYVHLSASFKSFIARISQERESLMRYYPLINWGIYQHCCRVSSFPIYPDQMYNKEGLYLRYWLHQAHHNLNSLEILPFYDWLADNINLHSVIKSSNILYIIDRLTMKVVVLIKKLFD